jgi:rare lipoprotein A
MTASWSRRCSLSSGSIHQQARPITALVARARILDLSRGAAEELGVKALGVTAVRVRRVEPTEKDRARLRKGKPATALPPVPEAVLANLRAQLKTAGY